MPDRPIRVPVRQLKNRLSAYLRRVREGGELVITSRGEPVARLLPAARRAPTEHEVLARLGALPWVRPGWGGRPKGAAHPIRWKPGDTLASDMVAEDRG